MEYLASMDIVHQNIAARNVVVSKGNAKYDHESYDTFGLKFVIFH